jgi:hypothetical protein
MGTVLELSNLELPTRTQGRTGTVLARIKPAAAVPESAWLTATIRPAGTFDLQAARLRSHRAGEVIEDAAWDIERREGSLLCTNVSAESRACLSAAGNHAVLMDDESLRVSLR